MRLFIRKSLVRPEPDKQFYLAKGHASLIEHTGSLATSAVGSKGEGQQRQAGYFRREINPKNPRWPDGSIRYDYYATAEAWQAHLRQLKKDNETKFGKDSASRLEDKVKEEHEQHSKEVTQHTKKTVKQDVSSSPEKKAATHSIYSGKK